MGGGGEENKERVECSVNKSGCRRKAINNALPIFGATVVHIVICFSSSPISRDCLLGTWPQRLVGHGWWADGLIHGFLSCDQFNVDTICSMQKNKNKILTWSSSCSWCEWSNSWVFPYCPMGEKLPTASNTICKVAVMQCQYLSVFTRDYPLSSGHHCHKSSLSVNLYTFILHLKTQNLITARLFFSF